MNNQLNVNAVLFPSAHVSVSNDRSIARQSIKSNYSKKPNSAFDIGLMSFHPRPYPALEIQLRQLWNRVSGKWMHPHARPKHACANTHFSRGSTFRGRRRDTIADLAPIICIIKANPLARDRIEECTEKK